MAGYSCTLFQFSTAPRKTETLPKPESIWSNPHTIFAIKNWQACIALREIRNPDQPGSGNRAGRASSHHLYRNIVNAQFRITPQPGPATRAKPSDGRRHHAGLGGERRTIAALKRPHGGLSYRSCVQWPPSRQQMADCPAHFIALLRFIAKKRNRSW